MSFRVEVVQIARIGHAVHDPQRVVAGVERTEAADADRGGSPGCPEVLGDLHAGDLPARACATLECCDLAMSSDLMTAAEPVKASFLAVPNAITITSSMACASSFRTMSMCVFPPRAISLRLVADERDEQRPVFGGFDDETAVRVGGGSGCRAADQNGRARHGQACVVLDRAGYPELLRESCEADAQSDRQCDEEFSCHIEKFGNCVCARKCRPRGPPPSGKALKIPPPGPAAGPESGERGCFQRQFTLMLQ